MGRKPCCTKEAGLKRGVWTSQEDKLLSDYIVAHGIGRWRTLPANAGLNRCGKSCRLRWLNYLRPDIKRGNITEEEEELILRLHKLLGNRWSLIAGRLPGRTDNEIKNYWNTYLRRKVLDSGCSTVISKQRWSPSSTKTKKEEKHPDYQSLVSSSSSVVIRTKATRCTRSLLLGNDRPLALLNTSSSPADTNIDEQQELVRIPSIDVGAGTDISFGEEDQYVGEWYFNCGMKEAEGMYSFLEYPADTWDSLTPSQKFQTS